MLTVMSKLVRGHNRCCSFSDINIKSCLPPHLSRIQRCACATSSSSSRGAVLSGPPFFTLEASVGVSNPLDLELLSTGAFGAEVHPHLPIATTWHGLYKQLMSKFQGSARQHAVEAAAKAKAAGATVAAAATVAGLQTMADSAAAADAVVASAHAKPVLHVVTVGAQLNSWQEISDEICLAAGVTSSGKAIPAPAHSPHADALLLVSGSHPMRQIPLMRNMLPGAVKMLRHASQLKQQGVLPNHVALWAVANPIIEQDASYTEQKIAAGAEVVLTQPPLDWGAFERWMADAEARGLPSVARLLIGFPCLSGSANAAFWAALCQAGGNAECQRLQKQFAAAEEAHGGQKGSAPFVQQWNRDLLGRLQQTPGVAGLHVMPITNGAKRLALRLAWEGAFAGSLWPLAVSNRTTTTSSSKLSSVRKPGLGHDSSDTPV